MDSRVFVLGHWLKHGAEVPVAGIGLGWGSFLRQLSLSVDRFANKAEQATPRALSRKIWDRWDDRVFLAISELEPWGSPVL